MRFTRASLAAILSVIVLLVAATPSSAHEVEVYAPVEAGYQYEGVNGEPAGFVVDMVRLVLAETGVKARIQLMPWPRIVGTKRGRPNTLIFTVYRNAVTEGQYVWVGPVIDYQVFAYRLSHARHVTAREPADLGRYRIGVLPNGGRSRYLIERGLARQIEYAVDDELNIRKFFAGRYDVLLEDPLMLRHTAQRLGLDSGQAVKLFAIPELAGLGYLAFSPGSDPALVRRFGQALARVKSGPAYPALLKYYGIAPD